MRRTITFNPDVEKFINWTRAYFLLNNYDINNTEAINIILTVAIHTILQKKVEANEENLNAFAKTVFDVWQSMDGDEEDEKQEGD
jgi:hypothetical protein